MATRLTPNANIKTAVINYTDSAAAQNPQLQILNSPGNPKGAVQFNNGNGGFGGDNNFIWNTKNRTLSILGNIQVSNNIIGRIVTNFQNIKIAGGNSGAVMSTDGLGNLYWQDVDVSYSNANVAAYLPTYSGNVRGGNLLITGTTTLGNLVSANYFVGTFYGTANNALTAVTAATADSATTAGTAAVANTANTANLANVANTAANANYALLAGTVVFNSQPNITSTGNLVNLTSNGTVNFSNANIVNLGSITNLKISGGSNNYILRTDGTGNLSWVGGSGSTQDLQSVTDFGSQTNRAVYFSNIQTSISYLTGAVTIGGGLGAGGNIHSGQEIHSGGNVIVGGQSLLVGQYANEVAANLNEPTVVVYHSGQEYIQIALKNAQGTGSADFAAYADNGETSGGWVDVGVTGSTFSDPNYTITGRNDGYVFAQGHNNSNVGGNLVLATGDTGNTKDIVFATGGFHANDEFARIEHSNSVLHLTRAGSGIKFYDGTVQTTAGSGSTVYISDTNPGAFANGTQWFNSLEGRMYIRYDDQWVDSSPAVMPDPDMSANTITFPDSSVLTTANIWTSVPASNTSVGLAGQLAYDGGNLYVCVAANTWGKTTLNTSW